MICKRLSDNKYFNYSFLNETVVKLVDPELPEDFKYVEYQDWYKEYLVINKWSSL